MPIAHSGRWVAGAMRNAPLSVEAYLADIASRSNRAAGGHTPRVLLTEVDVRNLFALQPTVLDLRDVVFSDAEAFAKFCTELSRSSGLVGVSLTNVAVPPSTPPQWSPLWSALVENVTIEAVRLHALPEMTADDAQCIAATVLPWNRTVVEWSFSGCARIGDAGAAAIAGALAQTASSVQRLSFRQCGLEHSLSDILASLRMLSSLTQLDVGGNPAALREPQTLELLREIDELLHRNCKLLHPAEVIEHTAVFDASDASGAAVHSLDPSGMVTPARTDEVSALEASPPAALASASSPRRRASQVQLRAGGEPVATASSPTSHRRSSFVKTSALAPTTSETRRAAPAAPTTAGSSVPGRAVPERRPSIRRAPGPGSSTPPPTAATAPDVPQEEREQGPLHWGDRTADSLLQVSALTHEVTGSPAGASPVAAPNVSPVLRRRSSADKGVVTPSRPQSASHVVSKPLVADVTDGAEAWQRIKEQYNSYIRVGSPSASRHSRDGSHRSPSLREVALQSPRYVLGKMMSKDKGRPSSSFAPSTVNAMYVRDAMPSERRKFAPWLEGNRASEKEASGSGDPPTQVTQSSGRSRSGSPSLSRTFVGKRVLRVAEQSDPKHPVVIRIVDGGDVTMIENDPREIGYTSRLAATGRLSLKHSAAFASNTVRDARWGVDPRTQVARVAQAPPPGSYDIPSSFDNAVVKGVKRSVTATGKPMFGVSGSERQLLSKAATSDTPGPGFYEIP